MSLDSLSLEIICKIAKVSEPAYRGLTLSYPRFARSPEKKSIDFMTHFGHTFAVKQDSVLLYRNGRLHSLCSPAVMSPNGSSWYRNGKRHRDGGPAVTIDTKMTLTFDETGYLDVAKMLKNSSIVKWYRDGRLHRTDGPAIENPNGELYWYEHGNLVKKLLPDDGLYWYRAGKLHRENGPAAISYKDGAMYWYRRGQLHRADGPAVVFANGRQEWWINGRKQKNR